MVTVPGTSGRQSLWVGLLAVLIAFAWSWRPSYWYDEAASISAADRSPQELWDLLSKVDAVHGAFYFVLHGWIAVFGASETATRFISVVGLGATCALVSLVGQRLGGRQLGLAAGLICVVLPGLTWAGIEVRQYSWSAAGAALAALLLLRAMDSGRTRDWVWYCLAITVAIYVFVFVVLILACHFLTLLALRRDLRGWSVAAASSLLAAAPMLYVAQSQAEQVAWVDMGALEMFGKIGLRQFFLSPRAEHGLGIAIVSAVLLFSVAVWLSVVAVMSPNEPGRARVLALTLPWVMLPSSFIAVYSLATEPVYQERYVTFSAPGLALLLGFGLLQLRRQRGVFLVACLLLVLLPLPMLVQQKAEGSKAGEQYRRLAQFAADGRIDGVIYAHDPARSLSVAYPDEFDTVEQINTRKAPETTDTLWGTVAPASALDPEDVEGKRVALISYSHIPLWRTPSHQRLASLNCQRDGRASGERFSVTKYVC